MCSNLKKVIIAVTCQDIWTVHAISTIHGSDMSPIPQTRGEAAAVMSPH